MTTALRQHLGQHARPTGTTDCGKCCHRPAVLPSSTREVLPCCQPPMGAALAVLAADREVRTGDGCLRPGADRTPVPVSSSVGAGELFGSRRLATRLPRPRGPRPGVDGIGAGVDSATPT